MSLEVVSYDVFYKIKGNKMRLEAELTKKDVGKKYLILEKSVSLTNDISRVDDIVIAHEWHDDIIAMKFKLVEDLFYLSSNTKLKEVK